MGQGVVVWTLPEGSLLSEDLGDSKLAGGAQGRWRESESCFDFVTIAVFHKFMEVFEKGWRPKVLAINVSKFATSL